MQCKATTDLTAMQEVMRNPTAMLHLVENGIRCMWHLEKFQKVCHLRSNLDLIQHCKSSLCTATAQEHAQGLSACGTLGQQRMLIDCAAQEHAEHLSVITQRTAGRALRPCLEALSVCLMTVLDGIQDKSLTFQCHACQDVVLCTTAWQQEQTW